MSPSHVRRLLAFAEPFVIVSRSPVARSSLHYFTLDLRERTTRGSLGILPGTRGADDRAKRDAYVCGDRR